MSGLLYAASCCAAWPKPPGWLQETGRAGRDGKLATCILYYSYGDAQRTRHMIKQSAEENGTRPEQVQCNLDSLNSMVGAWLHLQRRLQLG